MNMTQYDAILRWSNITSARSDAVALAHMLPDDQGIEEWLTDHVIGDVKVWRNSQTTFDVDGNPVYTYLPGYYALVSADHNIPAISNSSALQLAINRDLLNDGAPVNQYILINNISSSIPLSDIRFQPVFTGTRLPWA